MRPLTQDVTDFLDLVELLAPVMRAHGLDERGRGNAIAHVSRLYWEQEREPCVIALEVAQAIERGEGFEDFTAIRGKGRPEPPTDPQLRWDLEVPDA